MNLPITGYKAKSEYTHPNGTKSIVYLMDNMDFMAQVPPKFFELACVDPPYGIGFSDYERGGMGIKVKERHTKKGKKRWDSQTPKNAYFDLLIEVSSHQIIWGGNYFKYLHNIENENLKKFEEFLKWVKKDVSNGWIIWHKQNPVPNFADCELAWTSYDENKIFEFKYYGNLEGKTTAEEKYHPTQKPVALYDWIFHNYAKQGDKILDTHLGSGSSRIAAYKHGLDFVGIELDEDYYKDHEKRFKNFISQLTMF